MGRPKKAPRRKDITGEYLAGHMDDDRLDIQQKFTERSKHGQRDKTARTAKMRSENSESSADIDALPVGEVVQVFSIYCEVEFNGQKQLCVTRKTLNKTSETGIVVGDVVHFRPGTPEGVIERVLPRRTVLTRADSFKQIEQHPIVANADQMLIVASVHRPKVKWGLIDRMIIAAQSGGLAPIVCLNKVDLDEGQDDREMAFARAALAHYQTMGITTMQTSIEQPESLEILRRQLANKNTVLAGHSGVGKSSLIQAIQPSLDLRVGDVSTYTEKGRHTTTSARRYALDFAPGHVIDTPGVKLFGLWGVTAANLGDFFPDVLADAAPPWRQESYARIESSLGSG
jgi:ribosome biogenesis GTPase / thiamine phosphate phosphatase